MFISPITRASSRLTRHRLVVQIKKNVVAIKIIDTDRLSGPTQDNLMSEINILKELDHPHIVRLIDHFRDERTDKMILAMELCVFGDFSLFIRQRERVATFDKFRAIFERYPNSPSGGLHETISRHFLQQLASALKFLRSKDLIHRDVKPQNLLLSPPPSWSLQTAQNEGNLPLAGLDNLPLLKVADFGFARFLPETSLAATLCGSPLYMAPEVLKRQKYGPEADLWSVGTVLYEMLYGKPAFIAKNHIELIYRIDEANDNIDFPAAVNVSADAKHLLKRLLRNDRNMRMTFPEFFDSPVVKGGIPFLAAEDQPRAVIGRTSRMESSFSRRRTNKAGSTMPLPKQQSAKQSLEQSPQAKGSAPVKETASASDRKSLARRSATVSTPQSSDRATSNAAPKPRSVKNTHDYYLPSPSSSSSQADASIFGNDYVIIDKGSLGKSTSDEAQPTSHRRKTPAPSLHLPGPTTHAAPATTRPPSEDKTRQRQTSAPLPAPRLRPAPGADDSTTSLQLFTGSSSPTPRPEPLPTQIGNRPASKGHSPSRSPPRPSSTSMLSKALNMATGRLFGVSYSPPAMGLGAKSRHSRHLSQGFPLKTNPRNMLMEGDGISFGGRNISQLSITSTTDQVDAEPMDEDQRTLHVIEAYATWSDVVYAFAEVKYKQLMPVSSSSSSNRPANPNTPPADNVNDLADKLAELDILPPEVSMTLAQEAFVLYVKALTLLSKSIDIAGSWWTMKNYSGAPGFGAHPSPSPMSVSPVSLSSSPVAAQPGNVFSTSKSAGAASQQTEAAGSGANNSVSVAQKVNSVVQWMCTRFNNVLDKTEGCHAKLTAAQNLLDLDDPMHPSNLPSRTSPFAGGSENAGPGDLGSALDIVAGIICFTGITAEKLIYDRAMEMSRSAAINESRGDDWVGCECAYMTALFMLEAILDGLNDDREEIALSLHGASGNVSDLKTVQECKIRSSPYRPGIETVS